MGNIVAKLDSDDKVLNIKSSDIKKLSQTEIDKIINYYNKKGVLKISINMKKMELFIENNLKILSKSNSKLESSIKQMIQMGTLIGLSLVSNYGFIMITDQDNKKSIDGFDNIEHFEEFNSLETFQGILKGIASGDQGNIKAIASGNQTAPSVDQGNIKAIASGNQAAPSVDQGNIKAIASGNQGDVKGILSVGQGIVAANKLAVEPKLDGAIKLAVVQKTTEEEKPMILIIPKILLTSDRRDFIDYISKIFSTDQESKILYEILKDVLDKVLEGSNPEVKIANLIGVIMRYIIIFVIVSEAKKLGANVFSQDDMIKFASHVFLDFVNNIPSDRCLFNDKSDFFEFSPNVCNIKSIKQENCEKCQECNCPVVKSQEPCPVVKSQEPCPVVKPQEPCPVVKSQEPCPVKKEETPWAWIVPTIILIIIVITLGVLLAKKDESNLSNLSFLSRLK